MSGTPLFSTSFGAAARNGRLFEDQSPIQSAWSDDETVHRRSRQRRSQRQQRPQVVQIAPDDLRDAIASGISRSLVSETLNVSRMQRPDSARRTGRDANGGVTGKTLASGLETLHVARSAVQQANSAVMPKHRRGSTDMARLKRRQKVVKALDVKLACNNILSILASASSDKHNVADDCQQWQHSLRALKVKFTQNDMLDPFKIPTTFDLADPSRIAGPFIDLLKDFHLVSDVMAQRWQEYLRMYAQDVELESDSWAAEIMELSMTDELKQLVFDDLDDFDQVHVGAITVYKYMTNHMVLRNQETIDALQEWIRLFDIRQIDCENVAVAITRCKAVIRALDGHGLPANALTNFLNGFSRASCEPFARLCQTLLSMNSTGLGQSVQSKLSVKKKIFNAFKDLENKYIELHTKNEWTGTSHDGAAFAARNHVPFDVWVKDKICDNCGEKGHIKKDCPNPPCRSPNNGRNDRRRRPSLTTPRG